ncbi:MAG: 16S rRNA (guanine(966)-N(2))-methyltransferase RsmD [Mariprofundales bacterium]
MRITAGELRGRKLGGASAATGIRPTTARVREALFNILGDVTGWRILDCFAGSGIMALEALSRGATEAISIEQQRGAVVAMEALRQQLKLGNRWQIHHADLTHGLAKVANRRFDLVFADAPYHSDWPARLPQLLSSHGIVTDHLVIEEATSTAIDWPQAVEVLDRRRYGDSTLHFVHQTPLGKFPLAPLLQRGE